MPKTIIFNGRLITVTMERPEEMASVHVYGPHIDLYDSDLYHYRCNLKIYNEHLESLWQSSTIHASKELMERFKDGETVVEGKDYEVIAQLVDTPFPSVTTSKLYPSYVAIPAPKGFVPLHAVEEGSQDEMWDEAFTNAPVRLHPITKKYFKSNFKLTKI